MDESWETNWEPYVGRAVLGGMSGTGVVIATVTIYVFTRSGAEHLVEIFVIMGVFGLAGGAVAGVAVGYVIYRVASRTKAQPNAAVRIAIGTACLLCYGVLTSLTSSRPFHPTFEVGYG